MLGYWFYDMTACCDFVSDQCLEVGNGTGNGLPSFQDYGRTGERINRYHQAIIPSYEFQCCGDIRVWAVDVHPGGRRDNRDYTLNLQVWRPSPALASRQRCQGSSSKMRVISPWPLPLNAKYRE